MTACQPESLRLHHRTRSTPPAMPPPLSPHSHHGCPACEHHWACRICIAAPRRPPPTQAACLSTCSRHFYQPAMQKQLLSHVSLCRKATHSVPDKTFKPEKSEFTQEKGGKRRAPYKARLSQQVKKQHGCNINDQSKFHTQLLYCLDQE